jgi:hypothetical protein
MKRQNEEKLAVLPGISKIENIALVSKDTFNSKHNNLKLTIKT